MDVYEYAREHEELLEQIPSFVGLLTLDYKFAFSNNKTAKAMGFKSSYDIVDVSLSNVRSPVAEDAGYFEKEINLAVKSLKKISTLGFHRYATSDWTLILCEKSPLKDHNNNLIGLLCYFTDITSYNLVDYSRFLTLDSKFDSNRKSFSYIIEDGKSNEFGLSERQIECLFFLLRGKSDKEIGKILNLSPRTVESYINEIKFKMSCSNRSEIIEKAFQEGLFNIVPKKIFNL